MIFNLKFIQKHILTIKDYSCILIIDYNCNTKKRSESYGRNT
ncbi:protein of unknown function [Clostridium beijerinckii]|nr:protein of unknown function [Clostridium beijerinckii]